jgi:hypothetical protein
MGIIINPSGDIDRVFEATKIDEIHPYREEN